MDQVRILVVDDNVDNLITLEALVAEVFSHSIFISAHSGKKGIELCLSEKPDVLLLNITMPEMDGCQVCQILKKDEATKAIPIIMITEGKTSKEKRLKALESGADAFLARPVDKSELTAQIRAMLRIKESEDRKLDENERLRRLVAERTQALEKELEERKRADEAIKRSEVRFRQISSSISDISYSCIIDSNGNSRINWLYGATEKITGYTKDEFFAMKCWGKLVIDEDFPIFDKYILKALPGKSKICQLRFKKKDGSIIWVQATAECVKEQPDTDFSTIYGGLVDITESKHAEKELKKSLSLIEATLESIHNGILVVDSEGAVIKASNRFAEMWRIPEDILASGDDNILLNYILEQLADPDGFISKVSELYHTPEAETLDLIHFKDGRIFERISKPVYLGGQPKARVWSFLDITERRHAEEALKQSETQFREFFEKAADAIFIAEIETGIIVDVNAAATRLMNRTQNQLVGIHQSELHPPIKKNYAKDTFTIHTELVKQKVNSNAIENTVLRADGTEVPVEILASEVDYHGKSCMMGTFRDITERKKAEELLRESEYFFKESQRAAFVGSYKFDLVADYWSSSEVLEQIFGIDKSYNRSLQGWMGIVHPDDREAMTQYFLEEVVGKRQPFNKEYRIFSQLDGDIRWVLGLGRLKFDANGNVVEMIGTIQDISERKLAELARSESYEFNKSLLKTIPFGMDIVDEEGTILFQSENFQNVFGPVNKGSRCWDNYRDDKKQCSDCPLNEGIEVGKTGIYETSGVLGGRIFQINHTGIIFKGKKAMLEIFQDITERKLAEDQLREVNQRFAELVSSTDGIVWEADAETFTFSFVSKNAERILGYKTEEWLESNFWANHIYEDDRNETVRFCVDQTNQTNDHNFEYRFIRQDGRIVWLADFVKVIKENDKPMSLHGLMVDITERKLAEQKLEESQQLFQELFDASPDAIVLIDPHDADIVWTIVDCNKAACQMNGYTHEEIIGQSIDLLNTTQSTPEERITYLDQLRKEEVLHVESSHRHKDGHIFPVEISTSLVSIGGRELVLGIDRDITDRKLAEETVRESDVRLKRAELASKSGNWEFYLDSQIMVGSEGASEVYGLEGDSFRFDIVQNIPLPEYRPSLNTALKNLLEKDIPYDIEFKIRTFDTNEIKDIHSVAFFDKEKRVIFGIIQDVTDRKQAEFDLVQSEERYRRFISQISEGVYRFECDEPMDLNLPVEEQIDFIYDHLFIAECNQAFQKMYGIENEKEVIGKSHLDFHGGRENPLNRGALREFVNNGCRIENVMTEEINPVTGQLVYFSNNSLGIIENNQLVRIWGTQADITEKIRIDQIQQVLFSISNAALSSIDLPELIEFISREVGKLLDSTNFYIAFYDEKMDMLSTIYERDEKDVFETWPAENSITGYVVKHQRSLLLKEEDVDAFYEATGIQAFGTPSKVWLGVPLVSNKKTIGAIVVQSYNNVDAYTEKDQQMLEFISHQISISIERKKTEKDLKLMGKAFDQSPVTIVITDRTGNIEYANPKFIETTGYSLDEVKGKNPKVLQSGQQSKEYYKNLWETILSGNDWFGEFQNKRKNGETYWESAVISPITNENGEIAFFLAIKEDITEKKKMIDDLIFARNKAEESDRLKSSFLANMSHEIRTPLNSIIGFSELLLDVDFGTEQHEEFARTINESGNGLLTIISDIMDLSKIEAGQINLNKKRFSAHKLINDIQKEYSYKASSKGIELRLDPAIPEEDYSIFNDYQRLKQVLINFVGNAIKFTEKGLIEIGFRTIENNIQFYVKDTGIGIPLQYHQKIFERFRQVESSHTRKYGGNGLGLAISKSLVEMLGGEIAMNSEEGIGSTFYFTVPLS